MLRSKVHLRGHDKAQVTESERQYDSAYRKYSIQTSEYKWFKTGI
jgi:hypothetical protein